MARMAKRKSTAMHFCNARTHMWLTLASLLQRGNEWHKSSEWSQMVAVAAPTHANMDELWPVKTHFHIQRAEPMSKPGTNRELRDHIRYEGCRRSKHHDLHSRLRTHYSYTTQWQEKPTRILRRTITKNCDDDARLMSAVLSWQFLSFVGWCSPFHPSVFCVILLRFWVGFCPFTVRFCEQVFSPSLCVLVGVVCVFFSW